MPKYKSRAVRLSEALAPLSGTADRLRDVLSEVEETVANVQELQEEMQNWFDNLPEGLQGSDRGQRVETAAEALQELIDKLGEMDLDEWTGIIDDAIEMGSNVDFPGMYD